MPLSYHPLCIVDATGKFFEKIIDARPKEVCEEKSMLTDNQYGFRRGKSTLDAESHIMGIVNTGLQTKSMVGILTLDIKNAFNLAPWSGIATALQSKGVPDYLCRILDDYFDGRVLDYKIAGASATRQLTAGVP